MAKAKMSKQLSFSLANRVGLLSKVSIALADANVNVNAICAYAMGKKAYFMLITDKNAQAKKALSKLKRNFEEEDVVSVDMPNRAGELKKVAKKIADADIDIIYMYGTAGVGKSAICVFKTIDDKKAIRVINK